MQNLKTIIAFAIALTLGFSVKAQSKNTKPAVSSAKYKPPVLITTIGNYRNSATIALQEAEALLGLPLKITDAKNNVYSVSSYQFMYKKKGVTEDEATGKVTPTTSISANRFKETPLPKIWIDRVREEVKSGEELYFFDVIAKDKNGRVMYAPELKFSVQ